VARPAAPQGNKGPAVTRAPYHSAPGAAAGAGAAPFRRSPGPAEAPFPKRTRAPTPIGTRARSGHGNGSERDATATGRLRQDLRRHRVVRLAAPTTFAMSLLGVGCRPAGPQLRAACQHMPERCPQRAWSPVADTSGILCVRLWEASRVPGCLPVGPPAAPPPRPRIAPTPSSSEAASGDAP
jgi:hypothetical protein